MGLFDPSLAGDATGGFLSRLARQSRTPADTVAQRFPTSEPSWLGPASLLGIGTALPLFPPLQPDAAPQWSPPRSGDFAPATDTSTNQSALPFASSGATGPWTAFQQNDVPSVAPGATTGPWTAFQQQPSASAAATDGTPADAPAAAQQGIVADPSAAGPQHMYGNPSDWISASTPKWDYLARGTSAADALIASNGLAASNGTRQDLSAAADPSALGPQYRGEMRTYYPSWRERVSSAIQSGLMAVGAKPYEAGEFGRKMTDVASLFPPIGIPLAGNEAQRAAMRGDWVAAVLASVGMLPAVGPEARMLWQAAPALRTSEALGAAGARAAPATAEALDAVGAVDAPKTLGAADQLRAWKDETTIRAPAGLLAAAPANARRLGDTIKAVSDETGVRGYLGPIKDPARLAEKMADKRYQHAGEVTDAVRGRFIVDTPQQADAVVASLAKRHPLIDEGWNRTDRGYFDRKVLLQLPDRSISEVQLWHPGVEKADEMGAHDLFDQLRVLPPDSRQRAKLERQSADLYAPMTRGLSPEWKATLDIPLPDPWAPNAKNLTLSGAPVWLPRADQDPSNR